MESNLIFLLWSSYSDEDPAFKNDKMLTNVITAHKKTAPVSNTQPESKWLS
jgi:hypothetical protein